MSTPSNGTEGDIFMDEFCYRCDRDHWASHVRWTQAVLLGCELIAEGMMGDQPKWVRGQGGRIDLVCTEFKPCTVVGCAP